jgi:CBS domain-containing protein
MSLTVEDVIVKDIIKVDASDSALEAAEIMNKYDIGCLIVVEGKKPI